MSKIRLNHARTRFQADQPLSVSVFNPKSSQGKSTSEVNSESIHTELSINVLLRMKSNPNDKKELLELCKHEYRKDDKEMAIIYEFEKNYLPDQAIWWYTRESFLYKLLNKALRTRNIDLLYLFRFFIADIERQLDLNKCSKPVCVYRGQLISNEELMILQESVGKLISINSFLSTSIDKEQALVFLDDIEIPEGLQSILFIIIADPRLVGAKPFANVTQLSYFSAEEEVLMMIGSIFRILDVSRHQKLWHIKVELSSDQDHELKPILEHMKIRYGGGVGQTDLLSFGAVLGNMGKFDDAEKYFHRLLTELPDGHDGIADCYHNLGEIAAEKGDYQKSLGFYKKSLQIQRQKLKSNDLHLAESYNSIGVVYRKIGDHQMALESYFEAFDIYRRASAENDSRAAQCLNNIGNIYQIQKRYTEALNHYEKALAIQKKHLPSDYPDLGFSYSNIGNVYQCLNNPSRAFEHYQESLRILEKSLPSEHPSISMTLKNMGIVFEDQGNYQQALVYFERAAKIRRAALPANHPSIHLIDEDIRRVKIELSKFIR